MLDLEKELADIDIVKDKEETSHNPKRKSLGRGLGALLGEDGIDLDMELSNIETHAEKGGADYVDINAIQPSKYQPRTEFDEEALNALVESIKEKGVLQPLLVRKQGDKFELIAGERRWRASKLAGLDKVPVIEKELSDKEVLEVALVENLLRENLSAIEEAEGFQRLIDEFAHTQEALSQIVGKSRSHIANTLRLLNLPESVKTFVKEGKISAGHARALVGLENAEEIARQIIAKDLSVRQVEELVAKQKEGKKEPKEKVEKDEDLADIERSLVESLGLRIKISPSKQGGGKVVLQYASAAELDMIVDILEQKRKNDSRNYQENLTQNNPSSSGGEKFTMKIID
ncbi:MAG: ParB/RepB/Spo0J family partition protein [Alphaproteobacteria bacterium]|nr:ParB/RepB/Spo0J family partition protein [Alphaproteobacteria bacterium]